MNNLIGNAWKYTDNQEVASIVKNQSTERDTTEHRKVQETLQRLTEIHRLALDAADMGTWDYDLLSDRFFGDDRCREIFGVPHNESLRVDQLRKIIHPEDRDRIERLVQEALSPSLDGRYSDEYRIFWPDGSMHWVHARGQVSFEGEGEARKPVRFTGLVMDFTDRKTVEGRLVNNEKRLQQFIGAMDEIVFEFDSEGRYLNVWTENEDLLKLPRQELLGRRVEEIVPQEMAERLFEVFKQVRITGRPITFEYPLEVIGGRRWFLARVALISPVDGEEPTFSFLARDITNMKELEERLQEANRELDAFVHTISHDLRTPLTTILGYAQLVKEMYEDKLDEQGLNMLAEIEKSSGRMNNMVVDLLVLATVGKIKRPAEPLDTNLVAQDALATLAERISATGVEVNIVETLPSLQLPHTHLVQIFDNLIDNAVRYAGRSGGPIEISGERKGERVYLYVRDHGPGILPKERKRIFDLFYRGSTGKKTDGTGIGLATVQKIARHYGGEAWVEETLGGGSTFWVEITDKP